MQHTIFAEEHLTSRVDGHQERYLIEYRAESASGLLVIYIHSGLAHARQGFCEDNDWCMGELRNEVIARDGVYVSPDLRGDSWMNAAVEADLTDLISTLKDRFKISSAIVAGASMGGTSALIFASHHTDLVGGVIALCPATDMRELYTNLQSHEELLHKHVAKSIASAYGGPPDKTPDEYNYRSSIEHADALTIAVAIRHATHDEIIPVTHSRRLAGLLRRVRYEEVPGDHAAAVMDVPWGEYLDFVMANCDAC